MVQRLEASSDVPSQLTVHLEGTGGKNKVPQPRLLRAGPRIALTLVLLQTAAHFLNELSGGRVGSFDADSERGAVAWLGSAAIFSGALLVVVLTCVTAERRTAMVVLSACLAFLSLDEAVAVHERIGTLVQEDLLGLADVWVRGAWPVVWLPLLATVLVLLWNTAPSLPRAQAVIRRGLVLLVLAVLAEVLAIIPHLDRPEEGWLDAFQIALEEGLELGGWTLVATGLAAAVYGAVVGRTPATWQ